MCPYRTEGQPGTLRIRTQSLTLVRCPWTVWEVESWGVIMMPLADAGIRKNWWIVTLCLVTGCGGVAVDDPHNPSDSGVDTRDSPDTAIEATVADAQKEEVQTEGVPTPMFSIPGGVYYGAQDVAISVHTIGATIHYTLDGTHPTKESAEYTNPISLIPVSTTRIRAFAAAPGYPDSAEIAAVYVVLDPPVAQAPTFSPPGGSYVEPPTVTIASATPGATIYYTLDGNEPTASSEVYSVPLSIPYNTTIHAFATAPNHQDSPVSIAVYSTHFGPKVGTPVFSLPSGTYSSPQTVEITVVTPNAQIFYTTDGTWPTAASTEYVDPVTVQATVTIMSLGVATGFADSDVATAMYTIVP